MSQIDITALNNIRALQRPESPDLVGRILSIFFTQAPEAVNAIIGALASGDLETVRTASHSIKSSAAYVGATQLSSKMAEIEYAAREERLPLCQELCVGLEELMTEVINELDQFQDKAA